MTLTSPVLPPGPDTGDDPDRAPAHVVAVLVAHDGERWLPRALRSLAEQTRRPDDVVAVDTGSTDASADLLRAALGADAVVTAPRRTGFGAAVALGLDHAATRYPHLGDAPSAAAGWVWLLHDDCAPDPRALEHLLDIGTGSARVGVVGPKLVSWDDPTRLLEVGVTVSRGGRREDTLDGAVRDQGQHDGRSDVLAVGTAGLLARRELWDRLGGLDPALPLLRDDVDLCWRAHLAGRRVVVAPRAVVADAQAASRRLRAADAVRGPVRRVDRRHGLHVALARCAPWAVPLVLLQVLMQALGRSLGLLAAKAPRAALDELVAAVAVTVTPWRWLGSRWRSRRARAVPCSSVSPLLAPRSAVLRRAVEAVAGVAAGGRARPAAAPKPVTAPAPARRPGRLVRAPLGWVLLAVAGTTVAAARDLVGEGSLTGGALGRVVGNGTVLWQSAVGTLHGAALGSTGAASPADAVRAGVVRLLEVVLGDQAAVRSVDLLLLGAPVLSAISAYLAARTATRSAAARAWAAAVWGISPLLTTALGQGRLGLVAVHVLLPLVAAALARALAPTRTGPDAGGALTAVFAAALGLALVGSVLPVVLVVGLVVALVGVLLGRGTARLRALALLLLTPALLGPWLLELVRRPALVLAGPGAVDPSSSATASSTAWSVLEDVVARPAGWPAWTLAVPFAPLLVAGALALLRRGGRGRAATAAWAVALLATAGALVLPHVVLASPLAGGAVPGLRGWGGGLLDVALLGVLAAALTGVAGLRGRLAGRRSRWRRGLLAPVLVAAVLAPVAAATGWVWRGADQPLQRGAAPSLPAVAADAADGPLGTRTLVLGRDGAAVTYRLQGNEPGAWTRDLPGREPRVRAAAGPGSAESGAARSGAAGSGVVSSGVVGSGVGSGAVGSEVAASDVVAGAVTGLLASQAQASEGASDPVAALRRLAVGFVLVQEPVATATAERLDSLGALTRIGAPGGSRLWRVGTAHDPATARVRLLDDRGEPVAVVPMTGAHAAVDTSVPAGPAGRRLVLSEVASSRWQATMDGRRLPAAAAGWQQAFDVPASGGHLVVRHVDPVVRGWQRAQLGLAALVALLALPLRRPGERS